MTTTTEVVLLAREFLAELGDARDLWARRFEQWARDRGLSADGARMVKVQVLRLRVFYATQRHEARRRARWPAIKPTEQAVRDRLTRFEAQLDPGGPFQPLLSLQLDVALRDAEQLEELGE